MSAWSLSALHVRNHPVQELQKPLPFRLAKPRQRAVVLVGCRPDGRFAKLPRPVREKNEPRPLVRLVCQSRDQTVAFHRRLRVGHRRLFNVQPIDLPGLRLAVFFGCVGIFVNLFRGEMLDKSLHFYMLTPMRREVLLAGKYVAGLLATVVIFTSSTALQWWAMLWQFERGVIVDFLAGSGWTQFAAYLSVTALACVGYGSIFLAVGLLFRNPIIPTAVVLMWESVNPFLPPLLKKTSMIYYLQSLCPVTAPPDENMPPIIKLLISPTEPATTLAAVTCIVLLTFIVLVLTGHLARRLQINYGAD